MGMLKCLYAHFTLLSRQLKPWGEHTASMYPLMVDTVEIMQGVHLSHSEKQNDLVRKGERSLEAKNSYRRLMLHAYVVAGGLR